MIEILSGTPVAAAIIFVIQLMLKHHAKEMTAERTERAAMQNVTVKAIEESTTAIRECAKAHGEASAGFTEATSLIRKLAGAA